MQIAMGFCGLPAGGTAAFRGDGVPLARPISRAYRLADAGSTAPNVLGTPELTLVKLASPSTYDEVGDVISYSYEVTNTGNVTLSGPFAVFDDKATDESCPSTPTSLAPGGSVTCSASYTITQGDLDAGSVTNVAYATGLFGSETVTSNTDDETVTAIVDPSISLTKVAVDSDEDGLIWNDADDSGYPDAGETVDYDFTVTNDGNVTLYDVTLTDTASGVVISALSGLTG